MLSIARADSLYTWQLLLQCWFLSLSVFDDPCSSEVLCPTDSRSNLSPYAFLLDWRSNNIAMRRRILYVQVGVQSRSREQVHSCSIRARPRSHAECNPIGN